MKFYLLNETLVTFETNEFDSVNTPQEKSIVFSASDIQCNLTTGNGATPLEQEDCSRLARSIKNTEISNNGIDLYRRRRVWEMGVKFIVEQQQGINTIRGLMISSVGPLYKIMDRCWNRNLQFELCLEIFGLNGAHFTKWKTDQIPPESWKYKVVHEVPRTKLPTDARDIRARVVGRETVEAFVTVCLILDEPMTPTKKPPASKPEPEKSMSQNLLANSLKQILEDGMFCDATIVAEDGTEIKCHKIFICARSPVLKTMLQSTFVEGQTSTIKMVDMSENAVRAFMRYIYYLDTRTPEADCQIALDLLKAGDKYDIGSLTDSMKNLFLSKQADWFTLDVALESFVLARNVESLGEKLKLKCVQVLRKNPVKLQELEGFHRLFSEDSDAAKELLLLALDGNQKYSTQLRAPKGRVSQQGSWNAKQILGKSPISKAHRGKN